MQQNWQEKWAFLGESHSEVLMREQGLPLNSTVPQMTMWFLLLPFDLLHRICPRGVVLCFMCVQWVLSTQMLTCKHTHIEKQLASVVLQLLIAWYPGSQTIQHCKHCLQNLRFTKTGLFHPPALPLSLSLWSPPWQSSQRHHACGMGSLHLPWHHLF